ncbi:hypothetical protein C8F04DRAFT_954366 [Mycena alexandri]|uniref:Uncharacterized protein n=1 Tax=Mycena alexandri TaxID=1745969 RepID=A0AAD6SYW2_9AGAR|nr:hypothetical protein C8F04DRAFT_954366 [Mycena alexandri]
MPFGASAPPSPRPVPSVPAIPFPAVKHGSGQKEGEDVPAFMERRRLHNKKHAQHESPQARTARLAQEAHASKGAPPGKKGARVFIWEEEEGGFFIRRAYNRTAAAERWDKFTPAQRIYDSFANQRDLCTALAPGKEAEPESFDDGDDDDDEDFFPCHPPNSGTDVIPSIPDVPGRNTLEEETGERAAQVLERAYDLDPQDQDRGADVQTLPNRVRGPSALPTLLHYILLGDLKAAPAHLRDLTSPDSDLNHNWHIDVNIFRQQDKTLYEIRSHGSEATSPSILLESAATALQIIRSGWAHDGVDYIIRNLVKPGAVFHPSWRRPHHLYTSLAPISSRLTLGRPPAGYMPTLVDFGVYVQHHDGFLHLSRGRVALFYGGIVGRLARLVLSDSEDLACLEPPEDVLNAGARVTSRNGEEVLWYEALTKEEIRLICGVYVVETGT